jgi:hypothetical protein
MAIQPHILQFLQQLAHGNQNQPPQQQHQPLPQQPPDQVIIQHPHQQPGEHPEGQPAPFHQNQIEGNQEGNQVEGQNQGEAQPAFHLHGEPMQLEGVQDLQPGQPEGENADQVEGAEQPAQEDPLPVAVEGAVAEHAEPDAGEAGDAGAVGEDPMDVEGDALQGEEQEAPGAPFIGPQPFNLNAIPAFQLNNAAQPIPQHNPGPVVDDWDDDEALPAGHPVLYRQNAEYHGGGG